MPEGYSDLAGYRVIVDQVNTEFCRPCKIAKGNDYCNFMFYWKGTAPDTEQIDSKTIKWENI